MKSSIVTIQIKATEQCFLLTRFKPYLLQRRYYGKISLCYGLRGETWNSDTPLELYLPFKRRLVPTFLMQPDDLWCKWVAENWITHKWFLIKNLTINGCLAMICTDAYKRMCFNIITGRGVKLKCYKQCFERFQKYLTREVVISPT